ncbi:hypothetical protein F0562_027940 [Nyssa sinensis]|uniref:RBR-type E3 ubiquitin transferase n=1 Tax=Nyssa sinensis TaxID=561372 RepID=A0A5J5B911_9ASTE|nr:hypothetical protein F0562_027940 [Nyssa sinensis]
MFSGLVPGLNSVNSPANELPNQISACLQRLFNLHKQLLSFKVYPLTNASFFSPYTSILWRESSDSGVSLNLRTLVIWSTASILFVPGSLALMLYLKKKRKSCSVAPLFTEAAGQSPKSEAEAVTLTPLHIPYDVLHNGHEGEIVPVSDATYAEELQVQEALLTSLLASQMAKNASSSSAIQTSTVLNPEQVKIGKEIGEASQSFCDICLENKESWQMFRNESCSHSFCYDCTRNHIVAKIQDNVKMIPCPGVYCKAMLDFNACRFMTPKDILVRWDESLCKSLIHESQILYCPFRDCSAMLVNDSGEVVREIKCPVCRRSLCALCLVPWHLEFTCKEFQILNRKKKGREDVMVKELAKKKSWRKCPRCKYYVEKTEGCLHITCRCEYEFCYKCGSKWARNHSGCCQRS